MVPHLTTALNGPINELEQRIIDSMPATERWFRLEWMEHMPAFYSAVDVRNAGFKLAPVETDLYPGGWNYLSEAMLPLAVQAAQAAIEKICPEARLKGFLGQEQHFLDGQGHVFRLDLRSQASPLAEQCIGAIGQNNAISEDVPLLAFSTDTDDLAGFVF